MKNIKPLLLCFAIFFIQQSFAQEKASSILDKAYQQAQKENKNVFVMFHASWCGWCKTMDKKMNDASCKEFFDKNYVITHLVVLESKDNKGLENPGAFDLLKKYKGEKSGIPFFLIFDKNGKFLEDSFDSNGQNIGCPATEEEIAEFMKILKKTSGLTDEDRENITKSFL